MLRLVDWCANEHIEKVERIQLSTNDLWQLSEAGWEPGDINKDIVLSIFDFLDPSNTIINIILV